jgi:hypothetical protein
MAFRTILLVGADSRESREMKSDLRARLKSLSHDARGSLKRATIAGCLGLIACVLAPEFATAQTAPQSPSSMTAGLSAYTAAGGEYRFYYPRTWKLADGRSGPSLSPPSETDDSETPSVGVAIWRGDDYTISSGKFGDISYRFNEKLGQWQVVDEDSAAWRSMDSSISRLGISYVVRDVQDAHTYILVLRSDVYLVIDFFDVHPETLRTAFVDCISRADNPPDPKSFQESLIAFARIASPARDIFEIAASGDADELRVALEGEVDPNTAKDGKGTTILMAAAWSNRDSRVVSTLVQAGADPNRNDANGWSPLLYAAQNNPEPKVLLALIQAGAKVEYQDRQGRTALLIAARFNSNPQVLQALLDSGADPSHKDKQGRTALEFARNNKALNGSAELKKLEMASKGDITNLEAK